MIQGNIFLKILWGITLYLTQACIAVLYVIFCKLNEVPLFKKFG